VNGKTLYERWASEKKKKGKQGRRKREIKKLIEEKSPSGPPWDLRGGLGETKEVGKKKTPALKTKRKPRQKGGVWTAVVKKKTWGWAAKSSSQGQNTGTNQREIGKNPTETGFLEKVGGGKKMQKLGKPSS